MTRFVVDFSRDIEQGLDDGRLDAPAVHRNHAPITDVLVRLLAGETGHVIEIGSGTGQHIVGFGGTFPDLTWWPSDMMPAHITSVDAWRTHLGIGNVMPAVSIDASGDWELGRDGRPPQCDLTAVFSANVVHIAPWIVAQGIVRGAASCLKAGGLLVLYGPYSRNGDMLSEGNILFDRSLRQGNAEWGVRDVTDMEALAGEHGLGLEDLIDMPSSNTMLVFRK